MLFRSQGDETKFSEWRIKSHSLYTKHIKFKQEIIDQIDNIWTANAIKHNVIGIHYRHPSHFVESGKIYLESYFEQIDLLLQKYPESKIFLATDSCYGIYAFSEKYRDKIFYIQNIDRLSMSEFLHWVFSLVDGKADSVGFINGKGYELHHKRVNQINNKNMTIDLLKEILCLSRCNQIVNTVSNIPLAISYINPYTKIITI